MSKKKPAPATDQGMQGANDTNNDSVTRRQLQKLQPRHIRLLAALIQRPLWREEADRIAGASNSPHYIQELRSLGLQIHCERVESLDRDGRPCRPGRYHLLPSSRRQARALLSAVSGMGDAA
ncbi:hypothetical protein [Vreelandella utahensis]|uniref:hypothetical protein n=1 Tax=Vreelandella halophila TaxID=86177 RepID=UPI00117BB0F3|nr:hypothetical protein [Halomonas utahensis]